MFVISETVEWQEKRRGQIFIDPKFGGPGTKMFFGSVGCFGMGISFIPATEKRPKRVTSGGQTVEVLQLSPWNLSASQRCGVFSVPSLKSSDGANRSVESHRYKETHLVQKTPKNIQKSPIV